MQFVTQCCLRSLLCPVANHVWALFCFFCSTWQLLDHMSNCGVSPLTSRGQTVSYNLTLVVAANFVQQCVLWQSWFLKDMRRITWGITKKTIETERMWPKYGHNLSVSPVEPPTLVIVPANLDLDLKEAAGSDRPKATGSKWAIPLWKSVWYNVTSWYKSDDFNVSMIHFHWFSFRWTGGFKTQNTVQLGPLTEPLTMTYRPQGSVRAPWPPEPQHGPCPLCV